MQGRAIHDSAVETDAMHIADEVADEATDEVGEIDALVIDEEVATYLISTATVDTKVTTHASTEPDSCFDGAVCTH